MRSPYRLTRRSLLVAAPGALALSGLALSVKDSAAADETSAPADRAPASPPAQAGTVGATDPRLAPRIIGNPNAKVLVQEWFSLTCTHCAHFALTEFPQVKKDFIDTGKIRFQFNDFPMDGAGLLGAMVARSLPENRYLPFIDALFSHQVKWLFSGGDPVAYLEKIAALAGVSKAQFDAIRNDKAYAEALYNQAHQAEEKYHIEGTPYFRFNNLALPQDPGNITKFAEMVKKAAS
ncbi:thioredoxin domain-containing protein [Oecophyllibacter saccharovorans]|uniref:Thiol:disulfide interchange protein n=1 Tax=Oecophyllibacter saccharovorans TaxID=2558360 RepID=A0A506UQS7_9PROT|nr:thioredoxin domain-containing protein [Oecophyllibacter saccharovorans]TPW34749.1 thiol:disulfide interchange protein [Oecophyllibacter saccharovorans]TPW35690.1 thiol:disulfide interchange protein [Oecophyllibacter saccharovorans]